MSRKHKHKQKEERMRQPTKVYGVSKDAKPAKEWGEDQRNEEDITCSLVGEPKVLIGLTPKYKIQYLMGEYTSKEWLAYLQGRITAEGHFIIEDLSVPPHKESTYSSAEAEPFNIPDDCVGFIHSHHKMGAFHSSTDQTHVDRNYPLSITIAKDSDDKITFDAISTKETPCGRPVKVKCTVKYLNPEPAFDAEAWLKEAKENIEKGTKVYGSYRGATQYGHPHGCPYGGGLKNAYGGFDRQALNQGKLPEDEKKQDPPMTVITKKMVDKMAAKLNDDGVVKTRSEIIDMLTKNPDLLEEGECWSV